MIYTYSELKNLYGSDYKIKKKIKEKEIYKVEYGMYSNKALNHYLEVFTKKYPNAVITGDSAYYYHNLTDVIPDKIYMSTNRTSGRYNDDNISQSYKLEEYYELGKIMMEYEGVDINIYDKERMLVELVKNKNNTPYDYYKEIIDNYRSISDELNVYKIDEYTRVYPNGEKLMKIIQDEVF